MAMEDAVGLASAVAANKDDMEAAFEEYERTARPPVERVQDAARPSLSWWERFSIYHDAFEPWQFAYHFLTRSISDSRLERRDPDFVASSHKAWHDDFGSPPLDAPVTQGRWSTPSRIVSVVEEAGVPVFLSAEGTLLPLRAEAAESGQWGALVEAPEEESGLPAVRADLASLVNRNPNCVVVYGGTNLTRVLLTEETRLHYGLPSVIIDHEFDRDKAVTTVLSGRADLVGVTPEVAAEWGATS
jgi:anthraniloyl-CoA monooxygenase